MNRTTVNFILNLVSFVVFVGLVCSGIIIALPHERGAQQIKPFGIGRGQWGDIHLWLGIIFAVLMLVHLVLHWGWIKCYVKSLFGASEKPPCDENSTS